ncbi:MAG: aminopeptidase P N-terminal domain-containing protein [Burkholderiales bacterium]|nr:aminopeptidase P N-terminal domain-containing protein [Burkholderiales bacterium]
MHISIETHAQRRKAVSDRLAPGLMVLPTARVRNRNNDSDYAFRFDSSFYYLTGFHEPEAVLVQVMGAEPKSILFCLPRNLHREIWEGKLVGPEDAVARFGFDEAYPIEQLDTKLVELLDGQSRLYFPVGADSQWDSRLFGIVSRVRARQRWGGVNPIEFFDMRPTLDEMRLFKDEGEITLMREAGRISAEAHMRAMRATRPDAIEYEIEAELLYHFYRNGSRSPAYGSIVASGANATCLHYSENNRKMLAGELLLIDAGCELHGYAADITRTFPVSGRFSGPQRDIYELVLASMEASFAQVRPGVARNAYHDAAVNVLTQGLVDLGILRGTVDGLIETSAYKQFYMHGTGHWLGLDVHDAGEYQLNGESRPLQPGMVLTVEPGLYFRQRSEASPDWHIDVPAQFLDIGIRIEDDLVVTPTGHENLTELAPKRIDDIEALMAG